MNDFQKTVWGYFREHKRSMPWRETDDPYKILVSEIMLQQTQVDRVIPKYEQFIEAFPDVKTLAIADFSEVLTIWSGLGYNRRAKFLHNSAKMIVDEFSGTVPDDIDELQKLPGVGYNTAAAILAYAYKKPVVFIETNIRTVFIYHFFEDRTDVDDKEIVPLIEQTLDRKRPDEWYWALMDYGAHLKKSLPNPSRKSKHHTSQSKFEGSRRQIRGKVLKLLLNGSMSEGGLITEIADDRVESVVEELEKENLIVRQDNVLKLS